MALNGTMVAIQTVTVGSGGAANITFSNIPQTYTDLVIKASIRTDRPFVSEGLAVKLNNNTSNYSSREVTYDNGGAASYTNLFGVGYVINSQGNSTTSNTFSNQEIYIPNYAGSTNKSFFADSVVENNGTDARAELAALLWSNTAAVTSIVLESYTGYTILQHSTATLYGISRTTAQIKATGGMVYDTDTHVYHLFNASGTFTPTQNLSCDYLVVAGGGGGGYGASGQGLGGGGGAGGLRSTVTATGGGGSLESALSLTANTGYTVTVGAGGAGGTGANTKGTNGSNSVFSTITSTGGGAASNGEITSPNSGGSGGGMGNGGANMGTVAGGAGTANQGYAGGSAVTGAAPNYGTGGGGGAGGAGGGGTGSAAGAAGVGVSVSITGSSVTYGVGGAGSILATGAGAAGTANTGNGGGGSGQGATANGGAGGSGVVIVRYAK